MSFREPVYLGDCWIDEQGHHWFCKRVTQLRKGKYHCFPMMVKYTEDGFLLSYLWRFEEEHPEAKLYMREGIHPGTSVPGSSS